MKRSSIVLLGSLAAGLVIAACGGVDGADTLFGGPGAGGTATSGSSSATGSGLHGPSSSSAVSTSSSSGQTTTSSSSSSSGATSSSSSSSSTTTSSSSSSSSGSTLPPVSCNGGLCPPGQICCFDPSSSQPPDHCGHTGQCGPSFVELTCSGPQGCPGQVCCAHYKQGGGQFEYTGISCQASCNNPNSEIIVCSQTMPNVCPPGTQCQQSNLLGAGYRICN